LPGWYFFEKFETWKFFCDFWDFLILFSKIFKIWDFFVTFPKNFLKSHKIA
jgi:hypothetical protein